MSSEQRALAFGLIQSGLSGTGFLKATTIMSLEQILKELEKGSGPVRDPELYYVTIFGKPQDSGKWGWRIEGHHLSLNFALADGKIVSATPAFFGSNPGKVLQGPRQGLQTRRPRRASPPFDSRFLDESQLKKAVFKREKGAHRISAPRQHRSSRRPDSAVGITFAELNDDQKARLQSIVESYAADMPLEVAKAWLDEIVRAGTDSVRFTWAGPADRTQGHAYRVQGPTFLIEFNNTQNNAKHVHAVWRNMFGDFGVPVAQK